MMMTVIAVVEAEMTIAMMGDETMIETTDSRHPVLHQACPRSPPSVFLDSPSKCQRYQTACQCFLLASFSLASSSRSLSSRPLQDTALRILFRDRKILYQHPAIHLDHLDY
jgi:hypothetical protein